MTKEEIKIILRKGKANEIAQALQLFAKENWGKPQKNLYEVAEKIFNGSNDPLPF